MREAENMINGEVRSVVEAQFNSMTNNNAFPVAMNIFYELRDELQLVNLEPSLKLEHRWAIINLFCQVILSIYQKNDATDPKMCDKIHILNKNMITQNQMGILEALAFLPIDTIDD